MVAAAAKFDMTCSLDMGIPIDKKRKRITVTMPTSFPMPFTHKPAAIKKHTRLVCVCDSKVLELQKEMKTNNCCRSAKARKKQLKLTRRRQLDGR